MGHVFAYAHAHVKCLRWSKILQQSHLDLNISLQLSVKYCATKVRYAHSDRTEATRVKNLVVLVFAEQSRFTKTA